MAEEYLNSLKENIYEKKKRLQIEKKKLEKQHQKIEQLLELSKEEEEAGYDLFTPRSVKQNLKEKRKKLEEQKEELIRQKDKLKQQITENNKDIESVREIEQKFHEIEKKERKTIAVETEQKDTEENKKECYNWEQILHRMELCYRLIDLDPVRCKLEMNGVMEQIQQNIGKTEK